MRLNERQTDREANIERERDKMRLEKNRMREKDREVETRDRQREKGKRNHVCGDEKLAGAPSETSFYMSAINHPALPVVAWTAPGPGVQKALPKKWTVSSTFSGNTVTLKMTLRMHGTTAADNGCLHSSPQKKGAEEKRGEISGEKYRVHALRSERQEEWSVGWLVVVVVVVQGVVIFSERCGKRSEKRKGTHRQMHRLAGERRQRNKKIQAREADEEGSRAGRKGEGEEEWRSREDRQTQQT